jgi:hypothetical protein
MAVDVTKPFANDDVGDNLNPIGRVFYSASTLICTPASLSQEVGRGLGAQAGGSGGRPKHLSTSSSKRDHRRRYGIYPDY